MKDWLLEEFEIKRENSWSDEKAIPPKYKSSIRVKNNGSGYNSMTFTLTKEESAKILEILLPKIDEATSSILKRVRESVGL